MAKSGPEVGTAPWFVFERQEANRFIEEASEEFSYAVRNELDWLNEHMGEIYSQNQMNVVDIFKTPGKLRGKTPRTARKRNPLESRVVSTIALSEVELGAERQQPLADVFTSNPQISNTPSQKTQFYKQVSKFQVAEDPEDHPTVPQKTKASAWPVGAGKENVDSGYHDASVSDMDMEVPEKTRSPVQRPLGAVTKVVQVNESQSTIASTQNTVVDTQTSFNPTQSSYADTQITVPDSYPEDRRTTDESFVSAREVFGSKNQSIERQDVDEDNTVADLERKEIPKEEPTKNEIEGNEVINSSDDITAIKVVTTMKTGTDRTENDSELDPEDDIQSDNSSPVKPLVRKSSFTFASLPAREPLAKKSMGARVSRTSNVELLKGQSATRASNLGRYTGGKSLGGAQQAVEGDDDAMDIDVPKESEATKLHNKTSTQRLHERINMLGQSKEKRTSRSISASNNNSQPSYPQLPPLETEGTYETRTETMDALSTAPEPGTLAAEDDEDDWIVPVKSLKNSVATKVTPKSFPASNLEGEEEAFEDRDFAAAPESQLPSSPFHVASPARPNGLFAHHKSASASVLSSVVKATGAHESRHVKAISVSNPDMGIDAQTTIPATSPSGKRNLDGPLSASKAKFFSVLKSAKERFITSAGISAQAKMETLSPASSRPRMPAPMSSVESLFSPKHDTRPASSYFSNNYSPRKTIDQSKPLPESPSKAQEPRRTRSSTEKEQKMKERLIREQQQQDNSLEKARQKVRHEAATYQAKSREVSADSSKSKFSAKLRSKVGGESKNENWTIEGHEDSADEMPPPPPPKSLLPTAQAPKPQARRLIKPTKEIPPPKPVVVKVAMNRFGQHQSSSQSSSAQASQDGAQASQPPPVPPKQTSFTTKASNDSLRSVNSAQPPKPKALEVAAKKREQERVAQEKAAQRRAEQKREQEQKRAKAEEDRRLEQQRKASEQRAQEARKAALLKQRQQNSRPPSRQGNTLANALQQEKQNAAAPARADMGAARPISRMNMIADQSRPIVVPPVNPAKPPKRIFNPDDDEPPQRPAPQRAGPSYHQLDGKRRKTNDHDSENTEARQSVMKPPIRQSAIRKEPSKFPYGYTAAPTPSSHTLLKSVVTSQHTAKATHPHDLAKISTAKIPFAEIPNPPAAVVGSFKTPARPAHGTAPNTVAKSSPHYPSGENIQLPEIATDSEDNDSDDEFSAPSWADSPALRELLSQQQLVDPESVFGPIAPLQMEDVFRNNAKQKRFRDRTSSANWAGSDMLTEEERRRDREGRERMMRDGGWTYHHMGL